MREVTRGTAIFSWIYKKGEEKEPRSYVRGSVRDLFEMIEKWKIILLHGGDLLPRIDRDFRIPVFESRDRSRL